MAHYCYYKKCKMDPNYCCGCPDAGRFENDKAFRISILEKFHKDLGVKIRALESEGSEILEEITLLKRELCKNG